MSERLQQLLKFQESDPNDAFTTYSIGMEYVKQGEWEMAIEWFDKTLEIDPDHAYTYYQKAKALGELGQVRSAKEVLEGGIRAAEKSDDPKAAGEIREFMDSLGTTR